LLKKAEKRAGLPPRRTTPPKEVIENTAVLFSADLKPPFLGLFQQPATRVPGRLHEDLDERLTSNGCIH